MFGLLLYKTVTWTYPTIVIMIKSKFNQKTKYILWKLAAYS